MKVLNEEGNVFVGAAGGAGCALGFWGKGWDFGIT